MPATPIANFGTALMTSIGSALVLFLNAVPKIIAFVVILLIGWFIASALAKLVASLLRRARFDDLAARSGFNGFVRNMGLSIDASGLIAEVVKWFVRLIVLVVAFDALGLPIISTILNQFVFWLPNLFVALVVLMIAGFVANTVYRLVRGAAAESGVGSAELLAGGARAAVWAFAALIAVDELGIATSLVNILFFGFVAALALALGLAFGLGGRETAAKIVGDWYRGSQQVRPASGSAGGAAPQEIPVERPGETGRAA